MFGIWRVGVVKYSMLSVIDKQEAEYLPMSPIYSGDSIINNKRATKQLFPK